jgi:hypothetical protein
MDSGFAVNGRRFARSRRRRPGMTTEFFSFINIKSDGTLIPVPRTSLILLASCFGDGALSGSGPFIGQTEPKLAGAGRPGTADAWWLVERWEALRLALGARGALPREAGTLVPPPRVPRKHPGASYRPSPREDSRGTGKPRTLCAARMQKLGCLKFEEEFEPVAATCSAHTRASVRNDHGLRQGS